MSDEASDVVEATEPVAYAICAMSDIPSQRARGFNLVMIDADGSERPWPIVIVRWGGHVFGYLNECPHHRVNLDWERNQFLDGNGTRLMCGKHGALFDLSSGACVSGPCLGEGLTPIALAVIDNDVCVLGVRLAETDI